MSALGVLAGFLLGLGFAEVAAAWARHEGRTVTAGAVWVYIVIGWLLSSVAIEALIRRRRRR